MKAAARPSGWVDWDDELGYLSFGAGHAISEQPADHDVVARLHEVVREVTGTPVSRPVKRIGFI